MLNWLFAKPLPPGTRAPQFEAVDEQGNTVRSEGLLGAPYVLVFYPGDDTAICTVQLCGIKAEWNEFERRGIRVFGVNPQSAESHRRFRSKFKFPFPLLADKSQRVGELFHARGLLARRTVYAVDAEGIIRFSKRGKPAPDEILRGLSRGLV